MRGVTNETEGQTMKTIEYKEENGTSYSAGTAQVVVDALERARTNGQRVYFRLGDTETGKDWLEENDLCGKVGRSTGNIKIPLLIKTGRSMGGGGILTDCILLLIVEGVEVYRHSLYQVPQFEIVESGIIGHPIGVQVVGGGIAANFKTIEQANRWVNFMVGNRMCK